MTHTLTENSMERLAVCQQLEDGAGINAHLYVLRDVVRLPNFEPWRNFWRTTTLLTRYEVSLNQLGRPTGVPREAVSTELTHATPML